MKSEQGYSLLKKGSSYTPPFHLLFEFHFLKGLKNLIHPYIKLPLFS